MIIPAVMQTDTGGSTYPDTIESAISGQYLDRETGLYLNTFKYYVSGSRSFYLAGSDCAEWRNQSLLLRA